MIRRLLRKQERPEHDEGAFMLYVRCGHCGEIVRARIDLGWDLAQQLDDGTTGYTLSKEIVGSSCNRIITVQMTFDRDYRVTAQEIEDGEFATRDEFDAYQAGQGRFRRPGRRA
ncbi:MAG TPA: hypothetical protein VEP50_10485 [bacterium]|nr:hypothetical protein [bacterium]